MKRDVWEKQGATLERGLASGSTVSCLRLIPNDLVTFVAEKKKSLVLASCVMLLLSSLSVLNV